MYLQFSLDNSNLNSTPWACLRRFSWKLTSVIETSQLSNPIITIYIYNISHIYNMYINNLINVLQFIEYEKWWLLFNKSCVTKIALTTSWTPLFLTFERRTLQMEDAVTVLNPCTGWHFGKLPRLEDLHRSIDKKNLQKFHFPLRCEFTKQ